MECIGWHWTQKMSLREIASRMKLSEVTEFSTGDIAGVFKKSIVVVVHPIWGSSKEAEKILIYAHHIPDGGKNVLFEELTREL